jgi:hypothetical protein
MGTVSGMTGQKYSIETSALLGNWQPFANVTITNVTGQFIDSSTNSASRFYRALPIAQ